MNREDAAGGPGRLDAVADIFDVDAADIAPGTRLDTLAWDSMAMLSVMALARAGGRAVTGDEIRGMETVADILAVL